MSRSLKVAWGSLGVSIGVLALKAAAYWVTGSVALYSDALETVINVVAALGALGAIWFAEKPADANHPYGHHKAEYLSAVVEGALVLVTAFAIGHEAWLGWEHPRALETPFLGVALNGAGGVVNLGWALVLIRSGRRWKSPALVAGGRHIMTDVWTTGAVLIGVALVPLTGWLRLDPLVAALVALNILWTGYGMLRESVGGLMDEVADPEAVAELRRIISEHADGAIQLYSRLSEMPCRRATAATLPPSASTSSSSAAFCAGLHFRRRVMISAPDTAPPSGVLQKDPQQERHFRCHTPHRNTVQAMRLRSPSSLSKIQIGAPTATPPNPTVRAREAGERVILEELGGADLGGLFSAAELAEKVYLAMRRVDDIFTVEESRKMTDGEVSLMKKPGRSYPLPALRPQRTYPVICLMPRSGSILIYRLRRAARGDQGAALERLGEIFAIEHPFNTRHDH